MRFQIARTQLCGKFWICLFNLRIQELILWWGHIRGGFTCLFHITKGTSYPFLKNIYQRNKFRVICNLWPFIAFFYGKCIFLTSFPAIEIMDTDYLTHLFKMCLSTILILLKLELKNHNLMGICYYLYK